jgi:hypothetical protein
MRRLSVMSGAVLAAAALSMMPGPSEPYRPLNPMFKQKRKRFRKPADRSKKQYLLKGIRP